MAHTKLWSSTDPQICYFHEKDEVRTGKVGTAVAGVMSCYSLDVDNYDNENYRDQDVFSLGDSAVAPASSIDAGEYIVHTPDDNTAPVTTTVASSTFVSNDETLHIPPRNELKKQTWLEFWSGDGTGSVLYFVKQDKLISYSVADGPPVFIG